MSVRVLTERLLRNWTALNALLMGYERSEDARMLLQFALYNKARMVVVLRIHQRYNKLRALEERDRLLRRVYP